MAPMAPTHTRKRLLTAVLLAAAATLVLGAGAAVAGDETGDGSFVLPAPMLGDIARYDANWSGDAGESDGSLVAAWGIREPLLLPDGQWHELEQLVTLEERSNTHEFGSGTANITQAFGVELDYDPVTGSLLAVGFGGHGTQDYGNADDLLSQLVSQQVRWDVGVQSLLFLPPEAIAPGVRLDECLFGGVWAGQFISSHEPLTLPDCISSLASAEGDQVFRPVGFEDVPAGKALRFAAHWEDWSEGVEVDLDLWLNPASPYPVRIELHSWESEWENLTADLVGLELGQVPFGSGQPPWPAQPAPAPRFADWAGIVPIADDDADVPFPLTAAVRSAMADDEVAAFLEGHPEAYVVAASYMENEVVAGPSRQWSFVLGDPSASLDVEVTQGTSQLAAAPVPFADVPIDLSRLDSVTPGSVDDGEGVRPRSGLAPQYPTAGSLLDLWEWQRPGQTGTGWQFDLHSDSSFFSFYGSLPGADFAAGRWEIGTAPGMPSTEGARLEVSILVDTAGFDALATPKGLVFLDADGEGVYGPAATAGGPPPVAATLEAPEGKAWFPTPAQAAGATLIGVLLGLLYYLWPKLKGLALSGLFSRIAGPKLLEHPARSLLVTLVQAEPGIHYNDLLRRSGLSNGAAMHHLRKLTKAGLLAARPLGRYTCYFPGSSPDRASLASAGALRTEGARRIYEAIQANPGLSGLELATRLGLQPSTIHHHVQRLTEAGLVAAQRDGRALRLHAVTASS